MATRYDILPVAQRLFLPALAPLRRLGFVLYGGTAIALRLGHRTSIDFDFFTDKVMDRAALHDAVPLLADAAILQDERKTLTVQAPPARGEPPVKISFFSDLGFGRVGRPELDDQRYLIMASMEDLLGHKLKVLLQRVELKDYVDIAAMLDSGQSLADGLEAAMALFPNFPPCEAIKALVHFEDGDLAGLAAAQRAALVAHAGRLRTLAPVPVLSRALDDTG